jgi:hypothetical protein
VGNLFAAAMLVDIDLLAKREKFLPYIVLRIAMLIQNVIRIDKRKSLFDPELHKQRLLLKDYTPVRP